MSPLLDVRKDIQSVKKLKCCYVGDGDLMEQLELDADDCKCFRVVVVTATMSIISCCSRMVFHSVICSPKLS